MSHILKLPSGFDDPTFWVIIGLIAFLGLLAYLKVPGLITKALDGRAQAIADELDEAKRLREEAQEMLAALQRQQRDAEKEAEAILEQARRDADQMTQDMRADMRVRLERREEMARQKIAQAEADAVAAVRTRATELAVAAAEELLREQVSGPAGDRLIDAGVSELATRLK